MNTTISESSQRGVGTSSSVLPAENWVDGGASPMVRVRGLRAPQAASVHLCRHCGTPLSGAAAEADEFCCAGCSYVHRLVHEHGLEGYYRIRDAVVPPVDPAVFQPRDFAWLTQLQAEVESSLDGGGARRGPPELVLEVQGISCAGCVWLIEKLFHEQPGALAIETDAPGGRLRLRWKRGEFDAPAFARTLQSFNYLVGPAGAEPPEAESRRLLRQVGLCAAFAMNLMLFALPRYFGMDSTFEYARLFDTLALVFGTLSLFTGGTYFIGRAVRAVRHGVLHIDMPIAVGIVGAYAGSVFGWLTEREEYVYFDFVGAFILLMLVGRWAQLAAVERNRRRLLSVHAGPQAVEVFAGDQRSTRSAENLRAGDHFELRPGQVTPVEAQLEGAVASFSLAWITGEAEPREYRAGGTVPAGAILLARTPVRLRAGQGWGDSLLAQLFRAPTPDAFRHRALERVVAGYLVAIFVVATLAAVGWWWRTHDLLLTGAIVTAVLVVSCPCAVGLAFPLADEWATVALRRAGVFVREAELWPRLGRVRKIIFDKTGTLTLENPVLQNPEALAALDPASRAALFTLVYDSLHPISQSLRERLCAPGDRPRTLDEAGPVTEMPGWGAFCTAAGVRWSLGRAGWRGEGESGQTPAGAEGATELRRNGEVVARFVFADEVRPGAPEEIAALRAVGFEVFILSGDHPDKVRAMAQQLSLPAENAIGGASPRQKADWIRQHDCRDTLMLGDGANDTLAFAAALARGTPVVHRGLLEARADFYYLGRGLEGLRRLFAVNVARRRTQTWLLVSSIAYNSVAVGMAVSGHVNPLVAAVLMPISSLLSLSIVGLGMRRVRKC